MAIPPEWRLIFVRKTPNSPLRKCVMCQAEYKPTHPQQKYCPQCKPIAVRETKRRWYKKHYPNAYAEKPVEVCVVCGAKKSASYNGLPYCNKHWLRLYYHGTTELVGRKPKNTCEIGADGIAYCKTAKGDLFLLDSEDVKRCLKHSWCVDPRGYLAATISTGVHATLHRFVLGLEDGDGNTVDHINGNRADNRKSNLRLCTQAENGRNLKLKKNNTSGYVGVGRLPNGRYTAEIMLNGKSISLGRYDTFMQAKQARIAGEIKYFGEYSPAVSRHYANIVPCGRCDDGRVKSKTTAPR